MQLKITNEFFTLQILLRFGQVFINKKNINIDSSNIYMIYDKCLMYFFNVK